VYHCTTALVPNVPPVAVSEVLPLVQVVIVPVMLVGAVDWVSKVNPASVEVALGVVTDTDPEVPAATTAVI